MEFIDRIKERVKDDFKKIVLPESNDVRVLEAASTIKKEAFADIILIGKESEIESLAKDNNIDINGVTIIDPDTFSDSEKLINDYYELRKHKGISLGQAKNTILNDYVYFANMLVKDGYADGIVSGACHSSADTLRPALQIIKTSKDTKVASAFFLMVVPNCEYGSNGVFVYSDCGMIQNPSSEELVEIGKESANTFRLLVEEEPNVAFLSHSTFGSSKCADVDKVVKAVEMARKEYPDINLDGELQFDAAVVPLVAKSKAPNSSVAGKANVLIFPDLDAGNIGYKITERLAKAKAYGPVTQGLAKPVNDLSRGCNANDIVGVVAITALQAMNSK